MDFHILTKKQAECLRQIHARTKVSSFFEPLRTVRELESLVLIRRFPTTEFDSGFGYELTGAGMALMPFEAGTNYSFRDGGFVIVNERPIHSETDRHLQQEVVRLERSNKNLCDALLQQAGKVCNLTEQNRNQAETIREYMGRISDLEGIVARGDKVRIDLDQKCAQMEKELVKVQGELKLVRSLHAANDTARRLAIDNYNGVAQALRSERAAVANLQKIVDDYAAQQKVDREVIKQLEARGNLWINTFADKRLTEGTYVFRDSQGKDPVYVIGTVRAVSDHCMRCRDGLDNPINLNQFTEAMKL